MIELSRNNDLLQPDNALHRFSDNSTDNPDDKGNGNVMTSQLIMDATGDKTAQHPDPSDPKNKPPLDYGKHYSLIFQNNPNCPPSDKNCLDENSGGDIYHPGTNKQLSLSYQTNPAKDGRNILLVTGFSQSVNKSGQYVGSLQTLSLQPTLQIPVGSDGSTVSQSLTCSQENLGRIAQMQPDSNLYTQLFTAQVMCQYNPICQNTINDGYCYLPTSNVTIRKSVNGSTYTAPTGFFIIDYTTSDQFQPYPPSVITNCPGFGCGDNSSPNNLAVGCHQEGGFMNTEKGYGAWKQIGTTGNYVGGGGRYTYNSHGVPITINAYKYDFISYHWGSPAWCAGWYSNGGTKLSHIINIDYVTITNDPSKLNTQTP